MEIIYSGKEIKKLLIEGIEYKPRFGNNTSPSENERINKKANKASIVNSNLKISKAESKPVKPSGQSTDLGNNKNMLDLQFSYDPGDEWKDRVKKQVTGEDSEFGNSPDEDDATSNKVNKAFYAAAQKATKDIIKNKQDLENSGLTGKFLPVDKKETPFKESNSKYKQLNFKNTQFLNEKHMFSLIPEDYKRDGNVFIMKDKAHDEYTITWKIDEKTNMSEGIIVSHQNKDKVEEEFNRIKNLYKYKSSTNTNTTNNLSNGESYNVIAENIQKLKKVSDN